MHNSFFSNRSSVYRDDDSDDDRHVDCVLCGTHIHTHIYIYIHYAHTHTASRQISNATCNTHTPVTPHTFTHAVVSNPEPGIYTVRSSCAGEGRG